MRARCPASAANLGPGFDVLALALSLYVEVSVEPAGRLEMEALGEKVEVRDEDHLAARVAREVLGHDNLRISVRSSIPPGRGLGSSAALALAAAAAAGAADPLSAAARFEGHPDNAAASYLGGLVVASEVAGRPVARRLSLDPRLCFVVAVPDAAVATDTAREALPAELSLGDAVFQLGRLGLLLAGLSDGDALLREAGEDRIHRPSRHHLFPECDELAARLGEEGALLSVVAGSGPSVLAACDRSGALALRDRAEDALSSLGLAGTALLLEADLAGLVVS